MGFNIKYTNGKRELEANPIVKTKSLVNDFIEALKGLKIKAEIHFEFDEQPKSELSPDPAEVPQVTATIEPKVEADLQNEPLSSPEPEEVHKPLQRLEPQETLITQPKLEPLRQPKSLQDREPQPLPRSRPEPDLTSSHKSIQERDPKQDLEPKQNPIAKLASPPAQAPTPLVPTSSSRLKEARTYETPVSSERRRLGRTLAKDVIVYGKLPIGSVIVTCPVAVDYAVSPPSVYIAYDYDKLVELTEKITALEDKIERLPKIDMPRVSQIVLAKSTEDCKYYRAIIESCIDDKVKVFYFDWGTRETVDKDNIKCQIYPELDVNVEPACAITVRFTNKDQRLLERVMSQEETFNLRVDEHVEADNAYLLTIMD